MKHISINRARRIFILFNLCTVFLYGCKSTSEEDIEANCRTETNGNCSVEADNGDDRGYNPCLVNKSLPVCNK
jgi:hypothetical protein